MLFSRREHSDRLHVMGKLGDARNFSEFLAIPQRDMAGRFLNEWYVRVTRSKIELMKKTTDDRDAASPPRTPAEMVSSEGEFSSGSVESLNNIAKLAMKKAYGFKSNETIEIARHHQLGKLPRPQSTHAFCG